MDRFFIPITGVMLLVSAVVAQDIESPDPEARARDASARKTILEFELLGDSPLSGGLAAHEWAETLKEFGAVVQVRQSRGDDKLGVTEKTRGTLRWVKVIGMLNTRGDMVLPNREFSRSDRDLLREWIDELRLYGAQGTPEGKPLWGLSESQFQAVFAALSTPISQSVDGEPLMKALEHVHRSPQYPVRFHSAATEHLNGRDAVPPVRQQLAGISSGTGLAGLLADYGLGFRPLRTPAGAIELVVQPLADISDPWPVGWDLQKEMLRHELAPTLFKMVPVQFDDVPLQDLLDAISQATNIPIIIDHDAIERKKIDLAGTALSYPSKRTAWIQVIHSVAVRNGMTEKLKIDENSRPFLHLTTFSRQSSSSP